MNMHARIFVEENVPFIAGKTRAMADFAPAAPRPKRRMHPAGIIGVVAVHAVLLLLFLFAAEPFSERVPGKTSTVVTLPPLDAKPPEITPPLTFEPPPLPEVPVVIAPEIDLSTPPPPAPAITLPVVPPGTAPPSPVSGDAHATEASYAGALLARLNAAKRYPAAAKLRHEEGVVSLRFTVDRSGRVLSFAIVKSSGSAALDREAMELIQRAQLPAMPPEVQGARLDFVVPLEFSLR